MARALGKIPADDRVEPLIAKELSDTSGGLAVGHIRSMDQVTTESTARTKFNTTLLSIFAGIALLLAAICMAGLLAPASLRALNRPPRR